MTRPTLHPLKFLVVLAATSLPGFALAPSALNDPGSVTYLKASNSSFGAEFGGDVAASTDTLVVGGLLADGASAIEGAAYVYVPSGGAWIEQARLLAPNGDPLDFFGASVAIAGDTIVVGAYGEDSGATGVNGSSADNSSDGSGAAYVFVRSSGVWSLEAYLKPLVVNTNTGFGTSVDISPDGNTIIVSSPLESGTSPGVNGDATNTSTPGSGAAYIFRRTGSTWFQEAYLKASVPDFGDRFGNSVAIDGNIAVVGTQEEDSASTGIGGDPTNDDARNSGCAHVYVYSGGAWHLDAYIKASNAEEDDLFGCSVSVSGSSVAIGASFESSDASGVGGNPFNNNSTSSGAAFVFDRTGTGWSQSAFIKASNNDVGDQFGRAVDIEGDALIIGAPIERSLATGVDGDSSDNSAPSAGAAYLFQRTSGQWLQTNYLKASNTEAGDNFGRAVALGGANLIAGSEEEDSGANTVNGDGGDNSLQGAGAAYGFCFPSLLDVGTSFCAAANNSTGGPSAIAGLGSASAAANDLTLIVEGLPIGSVGFFLTSPDAGFVSMPGGSTGNLCISGPLIGRNYDSLQFADSSGTARFETDLTEVPVPSGTVAVAANQTRYWQYWHRDAGSGGMATSNFSTALRVDFY